jgi:branched-chain amino acid transport system permease protein
MKLPYPRIALLAGLALSYLLTLVPFGPYYYDIAIGVGINIILAVSLNLVNGHTGQFSLGHAGFMAVGAYVSAAITNLLGAKFLGPTGGTAPHAIFFIAALVAGGMGAALAGLLVGVPSLRLKGDYLAIVTLGFGEIIRVIIQNTESIGAARGWSITSGFPAVIDNQATFVPYTNLFGTFSIAAITIYIITSLVGSTYGRGFLTVRDDEIAAEAMGINTTKYKVIAFVIAAFFAGVAGGLYAHFKQYINPSGFDFMLSVSVVVMVILGGMGSTLGVAVAAFLLTLLPEVLRWFAKSDLLDRLIQIGFGFLSPQNFAVAAEKTKALFESRMIIYSLLLIVLMLTRPQGLFGDINAARRAAPERKRRKG